MIAGKIINSNPHSKLMPIFGSGKWLNLWVGLFFFGAIVFFFFGVYFGLDFTDSFYHLNQAIRPVDGVYLYPFLYSSLIIREIIEFLGKEIIYLRFVDAFLLFISFCLPFLFLKVKKSRRENLFYLACGLILYSPFALNMLGYDTLSIFMVSLIFSMSVLYLKTPRFPLIIVLALLCAVAILIRLPNIALIPVLVLILNLRETKYFDGSGNFISSTLLFLLVAVVGIMAGYFFYYSGWEEFITATGNTGSHHVSDLLTNYFRDALKLLPFIIFIVSTFFLYKKYYKRYNFILYPSIIFAYSLVLAYFKVYEAYKFNYAIFLLALAISIIGIHFYNCRKNLYGFQQLVLFLFLLILFVNPFGSDTGLLKGYSMFLLLPFILAIIDLKFKLFWFTVMLAIVPFTVFTKIWAPYQDMNLLAYNTTLNHELLYPIRTKEIRAVYLEEIDTLIKELVKQNYKVYFHGNRSHIFEYLYPGSAFKIRAFSQPLNDLTYLPQIIQETSNKAKVAIFLVPHYPEFPVTNFDLLEEELLKMNFVKAEKYNQIFFLKN